MTAARKTPSVKCATGRKRFGTKQACGAASVRIANTQKLWRVPEPCAQCNGWHLSGVLK